MTGQVLPPGALDGFFDDAALFPPGSLPLPEAVPAHHGHRAAWYAPLVGPFVCPAARLGEVAAAAGGPLPISAVLPGGPAEAEAACAAGGAGPLLAVEAVLPAGTSPREAVAVLERSLPDGVAGYLEVPRDERREPTLDALAGTRVRAKFRTGGLTPAAHPDERELAGALLGAVRRGVPFKCTAGLHHAVRHTDGALEQHGFLNVLLAVDAALGGADPAAVADVLAERSPAEVARRVTAAAAAGRLAAARRSFLSFGTCSVSDPITDLVALGLVRRPEEDSA